MDQIAKFLSRLKIPYREWGWRGYPLIFSIVIHRHLTESKDATSIWDFDWDVLLVLDSCRVDWMQHVAPEYDYIPQVESIWSVGGTSSEWVEETFVKTSDDMLKDVAYITGNPYSELVDESRFAYYDNANIYDAHGLDVPVPPADVMTNQTIRYARKSDWDQIIVHYMQPHKPFFQQDRPREHPKIVGEWTLGKEPYHRVFREELTTEQLHEAFIGNLRYVLDEVEVLLSNIDAEQVVLTADHGQALGERFLFDHHRGVQHPETRLVPWVETTATDEHTIEPPEYETEEYNRTRRLEALGYI